MEQIRKGMKEIDQNREQREKHWRELRKDIEKAKEEVEILERKTIRRKTITILQNNSSNDKIDFKKGQENMEPVFSQPYSCCREIWCTCGTNGLIVYENENEIDNDNEVAQENESYYSEKHAEDIISHYSYDSEESTENPNG